MIKKAVINPKNEHDEKYFEWVVTAALHYNEIKSRPEYIRYIVGYAKNYYWSRLKFPVAINKINEFQKNSNISVNVLGVEEQKVCICRKSKYNV